MTGYLHHNSLETNYMLVSPASLLSVSQTFALSDAKARIPHSP